MNNEGNNNYDFVKSASSYDTPKATQHKSHGFLKTVCVPFISGVVGTSLVLGLCFYAPALKDKLNGDTKTQNSVEKIFTSKGAANTAVDINEYSKTSIAVASKALPSVVGIEVSFSVTPNSFFFSQGGNTTSTATGSGVIISKDGYILTNNHVVDTSSSASNSFYSVSEANEVLVYLYNEKDPVTAKIVGTDSLTDLAVLKIDKDNLTPIEFGDSDSVQVGEFVMAVGSPLNMRNTVTSGIVSAKDREIDDESDTMYTLIQTDAAINSGNSGGALVNAEGKLIGINTLKMYGTGIEGMGFAIPVNATFDITEQLIAKGKVSRPYIGITGQDVTEYLSSRYDYKLPVGIYVHSIEEDGSAAHSDLKRGDVIIKFNGQTVKSMTELNKLKNACAVGDKVTLTISRDGTESEVEITLVEQP